MPLASHSEISPSAAKDAGGLSETTGMPLTLLFTAPSVAETKPTLPTASVQTTA